MRFLKQNYLIIRSFLLNGSYAYALYGIYALTIAPFVVSVLEKHTHSLFIAIFGFIMLVAEFFALNFKLKMVRIRAQEKQRLYKEQTGESKLPSVGRLVFFAFFIRLVFRTGIVMAIMTALGYECDTETMSIPGEIAILSVLFFDIMGFGYIYFKTDFYTDPPQTKRAFNEEIKEDEDWYKTNTEKASPLKYLRLEFLSDFILQIYGLMLFSSFWRYMNQTAITMLHGTASLRAGFSNAEIATLRNLSFKNSELPPEAIKAMQHLPNTNTPLYEINGAPAAYIFSLLLATVFLGLMPIRIAYWIEDSMTAFTTKSKVVMWTIFAITGIYTCSPFIVEYMSIVHFKYPQNAVPEYVHYLLLISFCLILLLLQIFWIGKNSDIKSNEITKKM